MSGSSSWWVVGLSTLECFTHQGNHHHHLHKVKWGAAEVQGGLGLQVVGEIDSRGVLGAASGGVKSFTANLLEKDPRKSSRETRARPNGARPNSGRPISERSVIVLSVRPNRPNWNVRPYSAQPRIEYEAFGFGVIKIMSVRLYLLSSDSDPDHSVNLECSVLSISDCERSALI
ncbi:hypothetical protein LR48_Vigan09g122500 [Vigna angularis]|uniref:Uncharacterized protein n=1 Tax=Phaseolus angularis TaxID=3914 RepID=A0A0L9VBX8_PHAAN|nr:hypothetical protein LR48_Vigan09g122500 [Vigna angularis]